MRFSLRLNPSKLPRHILVAATGWLSNLVTALVQLASIRLLVEGLGIELYAAFALLTGLVGWFMLADVGVGPSVQNCISAARAKGRQYDSYIVAAAFIALGVITLIIPLLYLLSPILSSWLLRNITVLDERNKASVFFLCGALFLAAAAGGVLYRIWYAEAKGYFSNILPALASLAGLGGVTFVTRFLEQDKLLWSICAWLIPIASFPVAALVRRLYVIRAAICRRAAREILKRAGGFWGFTIIAAIVLQVDLLVLSQFFSPNEIASYIIGTKIFGMVFLIYNAILLSLWPIFAEATAVRNWDLVLRHLRYYITFGLALIAVSTLLLYFFMPSLITFFSPSTELVISGGLIIALGVYYVLRIWTDMFAMVLQSISELRALWLLAPIQAVLSVLFQIYMAPRYGLEGIIWALILSFVATVSWGLPVAVYRRYLHSRNA